VLVSAIGQAQFVRGEWIKQNAIVIDVGTNSVAGNIVDDHNHEIVAIVYVLYYCVVGVNEKKMKRKRVDIDWLAMLIIKLPKKKLLS
jgi:hypothetical protein